MSVLLLLLAASYGVGWLALLGLARPARHEHRPIVTDRYVYPPTPRKTGDRRSDYTLAA